MIGDPISVKSHHYPPAKEILKHIEPNISQTGPVFSISVGGESGSGKSTLGLALKEILAKNGYGVFIFHMDDYFHLPPKDTHDKRVEDISNVGPREVNLTLLQQHIDEVKGGAKTIKKPLVHYRENQIRNIIVELDKINVVIAEGTYATLLKNIDCRIFMLRNYQDTYESRLKRARDPIIPFNEEVLKIEHQIISSHSEKADILVDKDYRVMKQ